jgi:phosphopantetheinyl transferase
MESTAPQADILEKPYRLERTSPSEAEELALSLDPENTSQAYKDVLSLSELNTVRAFAAPKRQRDWLAGRLAAKRLMSWALAQEGTYLKQPQIEILNRESGEPYVRLPEHPEFTRFPLSLSHSVAGGAAAIAGPGHLVGVDLETVAPRDKSFLEMMAHDSEWDSTMATDFFEQTRLWTLKEAVAKLLGVGFTVGFHDVRFPLVGGDARKLELHGKAAERWEALGRPVIQFDSTTDDSDVLSIAYTTGEVPHV